VWRISKRAKTREKKKIVQSDRLPQVKFTCVDLKKGPNLASLKSPVSIVLDPKTKTASVAHLLTRENLLEKKKLIWARISHLSTVQSDRLPEVKYTCVDLGEG